MISRAYFYYLKYKKNEKYQRLWRECISKVSYFVSVHTLRMQMKLLCNRNDKKRERTIICNWWLAHMTSDMRRAKNMTGVGTADMKVWAKILSLKSFWIPSALVTGGQVKKSPQFKWLLKIFLRTIRRLEISRCGMCSPSST